MKKISSFLIAPFYFIPILQLIAQGPVQKTENSTFRDIGDSRFDVTATVMDNDTWCRVEWPDPIGNPWELAYDDGEADDYFVYLYPGSMNANKFSPNGYPCLVTGGRVYVGDGSFPGPFLGVTFRVLVYDDDGEEGFPGTVLDSLDVTVENYEWVDFDGMTASITEGDFFLAVKQLTEPPDAAPVGVDADNPTYFISYSKFDSTGWVMSPLQDFMIRAFITYYNEPGRAIDSFEVARFSGFETGEPPTEGDTTMLDIITFSEYNDTLWDELEPGYYAYGIKTHFSNGGWSDYDLSNIVSHRGNGYPLPFLEQWNDGTFWTNNWLAETENWSINWQEGQPGPSAQFTWDPIQTDYSISLESYPLLADSLAVGEIYLDFDLKLENFQPTGTEHMLVQVWNWDSQEWSTVSGYSNEDGSFDWLSEHLNISDQALGKVFKIRFAATGENSLNIVGWYVENIHVYRECEQPENLTVYWDYNWGHMGLDWDGPDDWEDVWMQWDDGENSGNSIGGPLIFDVAARWVPAQLDYFDGAELTQISFFPGEESATYSVRVWIGPEEPQLVVDQLVENPVINQWNTIELNNPLQIDINQDLWVGYHIDCETGYPAGVDDGPAIDGYGNMIYYGGWSTLLEINPELDYNWNIAAHFQKDSTLSNLAKFAIYRSDDLGPYFLRDYSEQSFYQDDSICWEVPHLVFTYKVSALYISENDTCTSGFSNEDGDICEGIGENENLPVISIYPNPASNVLYIESDQNIENVTIFDSRGITMEQWNSGKMEQGNGGQVVGWSGGRVVVPVNGLPRGLYLVRVESAGGIMAKKVVIGW